MSLTLNRRADLELVYASFFAELDTPWNVVLNVFVSFQGAAACGCSWISQLLIETDASSGDCAVFAKKDRPSELHTTSSCPRCRRSAYSKRLYDISSPGQSLITCSLVSIGFGASRISRESDE